MKDDILKYAYAIVITIIFSFLIFRIDFLQHIELFFYNLRFELKNPNLKNDDIVLITYNSETLKKYNNFIPYNLYSKVIDNLRKSKAIGIDSSLSQFDNQQDTELLKDSLKNNNKIVLSSHFSGGFFDNSNSSIRYSTPINEFIKYSEYGYNNYISDIDGTIRRSALFYKFTQQDIIEDSFSFKLIKKLGFNVNTDKTIYLLNFIGKTGAFKTINFEDFIYNPKLFSQDINNKIVLIGYEGDIYKIPFLFNNKLTRLELHANNILTLANNISIKKANLFINAFILCFMSILGILTAYFFSRKKSYFIIPFIIFLFIIFNFFCFIALKLYLNLTFPIIGLILSFFSIKYYIYENKNKEISAIKNLFKPYLAPQMIDEMIRKREYVEALKGERRVVTVMFADIADFTVLSERLPTDEVVKILNQFLTEMTNVIFENKGTLDKYTGDGVMAVFGNIGKIDTKENSFRAVKTAIEMRERLEDLQKNWLASGIMPLQIRIGICTGEAIVGNIGSPQQMDLTVIGDTVNTASRLEELNKKFNTTALINKNTYEYIKDNIDTKPLGAHSLKGKNEKVEIFEVIGWKS
ncbi:MAG: adenylate/guanylate cyclase domain-containing protein [Candidatus Sericytochromatia bacterium]